MPAARLRFVPYALVAMLAAAVHLQVLGFPFVFDDRWLVVDNAFLRAPGSPLAAFAHHFWYGTPFGTGYYRPLVVASFALNGRLLGWGPAGFHLVNLLLHALNAVLVLALLRRYGVGERAATIAACLFAVHPASAWPVGSVVARVDLLPASFILLARLALARESPARTGVWFLAALLSKESAVAFLGVPFLAVRTEVGRPARRALAAAGACAAALGIAVAARAAAGVPLLPGAARIDPLTNPLAAMPPAGRVRAALVLAGRYLFYLLIPIRFHDPAAYGPGAAPPAWSDPRLILAAAFLAAWAAAVVVLWIRRDRLSLFLGFALASFLPASNLLTPVGSLYAQNFLYLPLVGLALAGGELLRRFEARRRPAAAATAAAVAVVALLGGATFRETRVWSGGEALFGAWTQRFPRYALGWSRLGVARLDAGDARGAEDALRRALRIDEANAEAHYNLGVALLLTAKEDDARRLQEALAHTRRAVALQPDLLQARVNASKILLMLNRPAEAETEARAALALDPGFGPARINLGEALFRQERYRDAIPLFRELARGAPGDPSVRSPLVVSLIDAGDLDEARRETEAARRDFPALAWFDFCLARVEARAGHRAAAEDLLRRSLARDPHTTEWIAKVPDFRGWPPPSGAP